MKQHTPNPISGTLFIISAASGTGKTSLVKALLNNTPALTVSISHTTRPPRVGEIDGEHYYFTDTCAFERKIKNGEFLEFADVFGNYYGTSEQAVRDTLASGLDVILEIDWQGALQVKKILPAAQMIFILPPSKTALKQRLAKRGQDSQAVMDKRLAGAVNEMRHYIYFDFVVINDDFATALADLQAIVLASRLTIEAQQKRLEGQILDLLE